MTKRSYDVLLGEIETLKCENGETLARLAHMLAERDRVLVELKNSKADRKELNVQIENCKAFQQNQKDRLESANSDNQQLRRLIKAATQQAAENYDHVGSLKSRLDDLKDRIKVVTDERDRVFVDLEGSKAENISLRNDNAAIATESRELRTQIDDCKAFQQNQKDRIDSAKSESLQLRDRDKAAEGYSLLLAENDRIKNEIHVTNNKMLVAMGQAQENHEHAKDLQGLVNQLNAKNRELDHYKIMAENDRDDWEKRCKGINPNPEFIHVAGSPVGVERFDKLTIGDKEYVQVRPGYDPTCHSRYQADQIKDIQNRLDELEGKVF